MSRDSPRSMTMHGGKGWPCISRAFPSTFGNTCRTCTGFPLKLCAINRNLQPIWYQERKNHCSSIETHDIYALIQVFEKGSSITLGRSWARQLLLSCPLPCWYSRRSSSNPAADRKNFIAFSNCSRLLTTIWTIAWPARNWISCYILDPNIGILYQQEIMYHTKHWTSTDSPETCILVHNQKDNSIAYETLHGQRQSSTVSRSSYILVRLWTDWESHLSR